MTQAWYAYSFVLLILAIGRLVQRLMLDSGGFASRYLPVILILTLCLAIYGYCKNRPIGHLWFWRLFTALFLSILVAASALGLYVLLVNQELKPGVLVLGLVFALIPGTILLVKYSFLRQTIWCNSVEKRE